LRARHNRPAGNQIPVIRLLRAKGQAAGKRAGERPVPGVGRDRCRSGRLVDQPRK
jgi:hypothetical protein